MPYNEMYFREEIQSLWDTAGHLARRHELSDGYAASLHASSTEEDTRGTRVHCLSTTL